MEVWSRTWTVFKNTGSINFILFFYWNIIIFLCLIHSKRNGFISLHVQQQVSGYHRHRAQKLFGHYTSEQGPEILNGKIIIRKIGNRKKSGLSTTFWKVKILSVSGHFLRIIVLWWNLAIHSKLNYSTTSVSAVCQ